MIIRGYHELSEWWIPYDALAARIRHEGYHEVVESL